MGANEDIRQQTLSTIKAWKTFLVFLEGFSLDKEIDDEAFKLKEKTDKLEKLLDSGSESSVNATDAAVEEIYDDTLVEPINESTQAKASDTPVADDTYEIEDFDVKKPKEKEKPKKSKSPKKSTGDDDESQSSGGSLKEMPETIPNKTWDIANEKECPISGRLTKRNSPTSGGLLNRTYKVYAAIYKGIFYYFDKTTSKKQKGAFLIADYKCSPYTNEKQKKQKQKEFVFQMEAEGKQTHYFSTQTEEPMTKWVEMFNKLAKQAKEAEIQHAETPAQNDGEMDDMYELEPNPDNREEVEEVAEEDDDDIYTEADDVVKEDKIEDVKTPSPPLPRREVGEDVKPPSPPPARAGAVTLRNKPAPVPNAKPESEIYDDGISVLPAPPKSWIEDEDQEIYDDAVSAADAIEPAKQTENHKDKIPKYETYFYGLWDCKPTTEKELEFKHGDMLEVIERRYDDEGWWVAHLKGKVGLVPKNFLTPAYRKI